MRKIVNILNIFIGPLKKKIALFLSYLSRKLVGKFLTGILAKGNDSLFLVDPQDISVVRILKNSGLYGVISSKEQIIFH